MKRINCLGVVVADALSKPLTRYPVPGEVTQVITESIRFMPGGGAANTSAALGQMGLSVSLFSKIGNDVIGEFVLNELKRSGVDVSHSCRSRNESTPFTYVAIHPDGNRTFIHTPGTNLSFSISEIDYRVLLNADFLLYQDIWVLPEIDGPTGADLLAEARRRGVITLLDECWGLGPNRGVWEQMLPHADYVLPSFDDMQAIYPGASPHDLIRRFQTYGVENIILKMGKDGCLVSTNGNLTALPSAATEIIDTTGAGDCFDAGFIAGLAHGLPCVPAAKIGNLAAAACVRHIGGAVGIPPFQALLSELNSGKKWQHDEWL
ncbi:carbohydrate kinase family protein [candidate division KSB1 bacterium]|nr:carbohydrate kinase family protein [candidate division KSB1 bacterium]